jgi:hypothetical protein
MKIENHYPQFHEKKVLILTLGKQSATFFFAHRGLINLADEIRMDRPRYADLNLWRLKSARSMAVARGAFFESKARSLKSYFFKTLRDQLSYLVKIRGINEIYLFAPRYMTVWLLENLPGDLKKKIKYMMQGNFVGQRESDLLEKISKLKDLDFEMAG